MQSKNNSKASLMQMSDILAAERPTTLFISRIMVKLGEPQVRATPLSLLNEGKQLAGQPEMLREHEYLNSGKQLPVHVGAPTLPIYIRTIHKRVPLGLKLLSNTLASALQAYSMLSGQSLKMPST